METIDFVFQYPFAVLKEQGFPLKGNWHKEFFKNDNPIVLELGCGKGEYAVGLARKFPDKNFIGIDIKGARMWTGACQARNEGLKNVAFLRTTIELLPHFFAAGEVSPQISLMEMRAVEASSTAKVRIYATTIRQIPPTFFAMLLPLSG